MSAELNAMLGEWLGHMPGPFGPSRPDLQLLRNRGIQMLLSEKALAAAEELIPAIGKAIAKETDPEILAGFAQFVVEAAERKWPGFAKLTSKLADQETELWTKAKVTWA